jgi:hypothetical protein
MSELKLSKAAKARLEFEGNYYGPSPYDYVPEMAAQALERPSDSGWRDDRMWVTHTLMFAHAPASDDILGESNLRRILEDLQAEFPGEDRVSAGGFGHWTYSHFDAVLIRVLDKRGRITPEFAVAAVIARTLRDEYPVYDEDNYSELEMEYWDKAFDSEFDWLSRGVEVSEDDKSAIAEWVAENYSGHSDPGWVNPDWITEAASALNITIESE